jgi:hypothetical protein
LTGNEEEREGHADGDEGCAEYVRPNELDLCLRASITMKTAPAQSSLLDVGMTVARSGALISAP